MLQIQRLTRENGRRLCLRRETRSLLALALIVGCLFAAGIASAAGAAPGAVPVKHFPAAQIFTFLFLMLGPFKIIGPFAKMTKGEDAVFTRKIALRSILFASLAILLAAFLGERFLSSYGIPVPVLALSAGIILFLVALQNIFRDFESQSEATAEPVMKHTLNMALTPLAFPTIVTPYGIAAVVVFLALSPNLQDELMIGVMLLAIMLLNLIVMLLTRRIGPVMSVSLQIVGAVLGVIQVALGLNIINTTLRMLWAQ